MPNLRCPIHDTKIGRAEPRDSGWWWCRLCKMEWRFEVDAVGLARVVAKPIMSAVV